jgi:hypothetical protein
MGVRRGEVNGKTYRDRFQKRIQMGLPSPLFDSNRCVLLGYSTQQLQNGRRHLHSGGDGYGGPSFGFSLWELDEIC